MRLAAFSSAAPRAHSPQTSTALRWMRASVVVALCLHLGACSTPPDFQARSVPIDNTAPWPTLLNSKQLTQITTSATSATSTVANSTGTLPARVAALRARAARLSPPVLDEAARERLRAASARQN